MRVFTTCRSCGGPLLLGNAPLHGIEYWHPNCPPRPYRREWLQQEMDRLAIEVADAIGNNEEHRLDALISQHELIEDEWRTFQAVPIEARLRPAAVEYAKRGWPVFPLLPGNKKPAIPSAHNREDPLYGKCRGECGRPGHGVHDATADPDRIDRWWTNHPDHNIGLACGHVFTVIDVDVPKEPGKPNGYDAYEELLAKTDPFTGATELPDCHGMVRTPTGGLHVYIEDTGSGNRGGWKPGIDVRGHGGYVVAPPSEQWGIAPYVWLVPPSPALRRNG